MNRKLANITEYILVGVNNLILLEYFCFESENLILIVCIFVKTKRYYNHRTLIYIELTLMSRFNFDLNTEIPDPQNRGKIQIYFEFEKIRKDNIF
jgi:hypothetical protein